MTIIVYTFYEHLSPYIFIKYDRININICIEHKVVIIIMIRKKNHQCDIQNDISKQFVSSDTNKVNSVDIFVSNSSGQKQIIPEKLKLSFQFKTLESFKYFS